MRRQGPFAWPLVAAALAAFVLAEMLFNLELVDAMASPSIDPGRVDDLTVFGKASGTFGFVLFAFRPLLARLWHELRWWTPALFLVAWMAAYSGLTAAYDAVLERVPVEVQHDAFRLMTYRQAVFAGLLADPELLGAGADAASAKRLALVNIAMRLVEDGPEVAAMRGAMAATGTSPAEDPRLRETVAAVFLPPMSMAVSLVAIVANLAALAAIALSLLGWRWLARALPLVAVAGFLALAGASPFEAGSRSHALHAMLGERLGPAGWTWRQAINGEALLLGLAYR